MQIRKYKVGYKVKIKNIEWYNKNKDVNGTVNVPKGFTMLMAKYCTLTAVIVKADNNEYRINLDKAFFSWSDEMFEGIQQDINVYIYGEDKEDWGYEVDLNTGIELHFSYDGTVLGP